MIDEAKLRQQRRVVSVLDDRRYADGGSPEVKCAICGNRTRDKTGQCIRCRGRASLPAPKTLTTETLMEHLAACRIELKRRQERIAKLLGNES